MILGGKSSRKKNPKEMLKNHLVVPGTSEANVYQPTATIGTRGYGGQQTKQELFRESDRYNSSYGERVLHAPFIVETRDADGRTYRYETRPMLRSALMETLGSLLLTWGLLTMADLTTSGNAGLNAVLIGLVYAFLFVAILGWRHTTYLPRHLNPAFTIANFCAGNVGIVVGLLCYILPQAVGATLAGLVMYCLGTIPTVTFTGVSGWYFFLEMGLVTVIVFSLLHNLALDTHAYGQDRERQGRYHIHMHHNNSISGILLFVSVIIGFSVGLYLFNVFTWLVVAINSGDYSFWYIYAFGSIAGGVAAWALSLITWNMNSLSKGDYKKANLGVTNPTNTKR